MLTKFEFILENEDNKTNYNMCSLFHGALMELLPTDYVEKLHENTLKPFSQCIEPFSQGIKWNIQTLNIECSKYIHDSLACGINKLEIKNKDMTFDIISHSEKSITYKNFIEKTYFEEPSNLINIYFNSPTSFKIDGSYINYPNLSSIYRNLIHKFDTFSSEFNIYDEDMLENLISNSTITSYKLQSTYFSVESVKIPSFTGRITIKINKSAHLGNILKLLLSYGEYSGIGIKTALGMGTVKMIV